MKRMLNMDLCDKLKLKVEQQLGHSVVVSSDFSNLSADILAKTKNYISTITLRRFWGNLAGGKYNTVPRLSTLDVISQYVGYANWDSFVKEEERAKVSFSSDFLFKSVLYASELHSGALLELKWAPDRVVTIQAMGNSRFRVVESKNSKLSSGDTFQTGIFVEDEPLMVTGLFHESEGPLEFVCGRTGGIKYRKLDCL